MTSYIGINKGQNEYEAVHSTSATNTTDVEIVVNDTNVTSRHDLLVALKNLRNYILRQQFPL